MRSPITVLKLGGSVLRVPGELRVAVQEVYREVRRGRRVVAVVSALGGTTDRLEAMARAAGLGDDDAHAALLATGEAQACSLLALELRAAGLHAALLDGAALDLRTEGSRLEARPAGLGSPALGLAVSASPVVVVPGFTGRDAGGRATLLGRGGSDLSAVVVAHALGAAECRLVKDVDGWFAWDPAAGRGRPPRFATLTFADALAAASPIVQAKAVRHARELGRTFTVAAPGSAGGTLVGAPASRASAATTAPPPTSVALCGLGTVGREVHRLLAAHRSRFRITGVLVRDAARVRPGVASPSLLTDDLRTLLAARPDVLVEVSGAAGAGEWILGAIRAGCRVVTAHKDLLAEHGLALLAEARRNGVELRFSAAVGGVAPMLESVERVAAVAGVRSLRGVLNGTCNFVLDGLARGLDLVDVLREARRRGFTEADPGRDLDGRDTAAKLVLLGRAAFGPGFAVRPHAVSGLDAAGARRSTGRKRPRLVAYADASGAARVALELLPEDDPLAAARNEGNVLEIVDHRGGRHVVAGAGAGGRPTATAVVADLWDLRRASGACGRLVHEREVAAS